MLGLESLDIMIGLVTIYLSLGLACTAIVEMVAALTNVRSKNLEHAMQEILHGDLGDQQKFLTAFYDHPLIQSLSKGKDGRPSYIPPVLFSSVVVDLLTEQGRKSIFSAINALPDGRSKALLQALGNRAKNAEDEFVKHLETHFDHVMDRAAGWVKSRQQTVSLIAALLLVSVGNVDTFSIVSTLSVSPEARANLLTAATKLAPPMPAAEVKKEDAKSGQANGAKSTGAPKELTASTETAPETAQVSTPAQTDQEVVANHKEIEALKAATQKALEATNTSRVLIESSSIPFGWNTRPETPGAWATKIMGLIVSTFAVSLGAPFWFEILKKIVNIRQSGLSPREKR